MPTRRETFLLGSTLAGLALLPAVLRRPARAAETFPFTRTDAQWRAMLSPAAYDVLRQQGTEYPFSSPLDTETRTGTYLCQGCAHPLYSSKTKYDSGTGWPSFWQPLPDAVGRSTDGLLGVERTEIHCANCGGHLGHVFNDGPRPTGLRYCMDGVALRFQPA